MNCYGNIVTSAIKCDILELKPKRQKKLNHDDDEEGSDDGTDERGVIKERSESVIELDSDDKSLMIAQANFPKSDH